MLSHDVDGMIDRLIQREGGYVDHPSDPGGETKYGISKRSYPDLDIKALTRDDASRIYRKDFYERFGLHGIRSGQLAEWLLDWLVHSGPSVIQRVQRKLNVEADGVVGPETLRALNSLRDPKDVLRWRAEFLVSLTKHPFIKGWLKRLFDLGL